MFRKMLLSKIHRATVTDTDLNYIGSISIDENILKETNILENETVWIYNINNGSRFETYVIKAKAGSGIIGLNGAAARLVCVGDKVIIVNYGWMNPDEITNHKPIICLLDDFNKIIKKV